MTARTLGPAAVKRLIPHRPPLLLVDAVDDFQRDPPRISARRALSINDPIFAAHFPALAIYPGALVLEGLAQAAALLGVLLDLTRDVPIDEVIAALQNVDRGHRLDPAFRPGLGEHLLGARPSIGLLAASELRFKKPVFPGDELRYEAQLERRLDTVARFRVEAMVGGETTAVGSLTLSRSATPLPEA